MQKHLVVGIGYGIYNTKGKLYFYDGKIEGTTETIYNAIIDEIEENTELNYNEDETVLTLTTTLTPAAQIGNIKYNTLEEAINAVGNDKTTIKILRNVAYTKDDEFINITSEKDIIIDLNGYKISSTMPEKLIENNGVLEIIDTSEENTGSISTSGEQTIVNVSGAKLTISGGIINNINTYIISNQGELTIRGGELNNTTLNNGYSSVGIYNTGMGNVNIEDGTINVTYGTGIFNQDTGIIKMSGGSINSYKYGIYNNSSGSVEITKGEINNNSRNCNSYGIYNRNNGNITIGTKGVAQELQEELNIIANNSENSSNYVEYGIYNQEGTLYYYGGKIKGITKAIKGNITEIEKSTEINISSEIIGDNQAYEVLKLELKETNVASVNGIEYDSIQKAVKACEQTESTIEILRDSEPGATIIIEESQNITINLNGYIINNYTELQNKGKLTIIDSSTESTGKIENSTGIAISNIGTMKLQSGSISGSGYGIKNTGITNIDGGIIRDNTYGIYNDVNGNVNIMNGKIISNTYGIYNYDETSLINIIEGIISSNEYGVCNYNGITIISSKGIVNNTYGVCIIGGMTTIKENVEIQSKIGINISGGILNIGEQGSMNANSPIITGETYGLVNSATGITYMYDGQVRGKEGATQGYITYTESGYAVANKIEGEYNIDYLALAGTIETVAEVNGIAFSNLEAAINSVIGEEAQTVKLTNGVILNSTLHISEGQNIILDMNEKTISSNIDITIQNEGNLTIIDSTSSGVGKISSTVGIAIENSGTLTLGQDDGTVSQDLITIEGNTYGIVNSGTFNFYDGTINGASAIQGVITNRPDGYVIRITTVNGKERYYLST